MPEVVEVDDSCEELVPLTRHEVPKRRLNSRYLQRYRDVYKGEGDVVKVIIVEGFDPYQMTYKQKDALYNQIEKQAEAVNYGMGHFYMDYSLGKRKRWELASLKASELPNVPDQFSSISLLKFSEDGTMHQRCYPMMRHNRGMVYAFHRENPCWRYWHATLNEFSVKTEDTTICRRGKFNGKQRVLDLEEGPTSLKIHVQYHVKEIKVNKKLHNSEKHRFWHDSKDQHCKPMVEGCQLNKDIIRLANGGYYTGTWEYNGTHIGQDDVEIEEIDDESEVPKPRGLVFADFLVPKMKRQRKRTTSDQWVLV